MLVEWVRGFESEIVLLGDDLYIDTWSKTVTEICSVARRWWVVISEGPSRCGCLVGRLLRSGLLGTDRWDAFDGWVV